MTEAGISAAMRERKPAVSMRVIGLIVQVPAASPDQKRVTPAPYGLTTPSPLTTTSRQPPWAPGRLMPCSPLSGPCLDRSTVSGVQPEGARLPLLSAAPHHPAFTGPQSSPLAGLG